MTVLLRSVVVWLLLLAIPYQGIASAQMLLCAVPATATMSTEYSASRAAMPAGHYDHHDHAAMLAAQAQSAHAGHHHAADGSHSNLKCSGSTCCAAAAPVMAQAIVLPVLPSASRAVPFYAEFLPAVDLAHPERPPQAAYA